MKPAIAVFTKDAPCNKGHFWQAFRGRRGFVKVPVAEAQAIIGGNAPKTHTKNGNLEIVSKGEVDYYTLTEEGKAWLTAGFERHLQLHPDTVGNYKHVPKTLLPKTK